MSHSITYFQSLNDNDLRFYARNASYDLDRRYANQVLREREEQQRRQAAAERENVSRLQATTTNLSNQVASLQYTNSNLRRMVDDQNTTIRNLQTNTNDAINQVMSETNDAIDRERRERIQAYDNMTADMNAMHTEIDNVRTDLNNSTNAAIAREHDERIQAYNNMTADMNAMHAEINGVRTDLNNSLDTMRTLITTTRVDLNNRIRDVRRELSSQIQAQQQEISSIQDTVQDLLHSNNAQLQNAREYLDTAIAVINNTIDYNNSNSHSWRNGDIGHLITLRNNTNDDIIFNNGTAARMSARSLFQAAMEYRANVMADEREWQLHSAVAHRMLDEARCRVEAANVVEVGENEIDVDYWTCGDLGRIKERLGDLQTAIDDPGCTNEEFEAAVDLCGTYVRQINEARTFAIEAAQRSADRMQLLQEAAERLETRFGNLKPEWRECFNGDERLGQRVLITSNTEDRIVLTAEPVNNQNNFRYDVVSYGTNITSRNDADLFLHDLADAVHEVEGIQVTSPNCSNDDGPVADPTLVDRDSWKKPGENVVESAVLNASQGMQIPEVSPIKNPASGFQRQSGI